MTAIIQSGFNFVSESVTGAARFIERSFNGKPPFYATENWIRNQRIAAVALVALGSLGLGPVAWPVQAPLIAVGGMLIGLSLIQQVIGDTPGCTHEKTSRATAGLLFMTANPLLIGIGSFFWGHAYDANTRTS